MHIDLIKRKLNDINSSIDSLNDEYPKIVAREKLITQVVSGAALLLSFLAIAKFHMTFGAYSFFVTPSEIFMALVLPAGGIKFGKYVGGKQRKKIDEEMKVLEKEKTCFERKLAEKERQLSRKRAQELSANRNADLIVTDSFAISSKPKVKVLTKKPTCIQR